MPLSLINNYKSPTFLFPVAPCNFHIPNVHNLSWWIDMAKDWKRDQQFQISMCTKRHMDLILKAPYCSDILRKNKLALKLEGITVLLVFSYFTHSRLEKLGNWQYHRCPSSLIRPFSFAHLQEWILPWETLFLGLVCWNFAASEGLLGISLCILLQMQVMSSSFFFPPFSDSSLSIFAMMLSWCVDVLMC